jgi:hypothetical protein
MGAKILQYGCTIRCPHGATASAQTTNMRVKVGGGYALLVTDVFTIAGCPFVLPGPTPHPCMTIRWLLPAFRVRVTGKPVLLQSSIGLCLAADGIPQGVALVSGVQNQVSGV